MKKSEIIITSIITFMGGLLLISILWGFLGTILTKDLVRKVEILEHQKSVLEQEIIDYKWQLEQVDQVICVNEMVEE